MAPKTELLSGPKERTSQYLFKKGHPISVPKTHPAFFLNKLLFSRFSRAYYLLTHFLTSYYGQKKIYHGEMAKTGNNCLFTWRRGWNGKECLPRLRTFSPFSEMMITVEKLK
jgi:hypothetical protein